MLFSSLLFVLCFLPLCIGVYYVLPLIIKKDRRTEVRNMVLLFFSLIFYALGGVKYLLLMLGIILINYIGGFFVCRDRKNKTLSLVVVICLNIGLLFFFKYFNFFGVILENVFFFTGTSEERLMNLLLAKGTGALNLPAIVLPIGISFYTFQALSYVIDVYKGAVPVQRNVRKFALYISFFPQLIAGPIVQYKDIESQIDKRKESVEIFAAGITRFSFGLAKKVLIANTMGEVVDTIWNLEIGEIGALLAWFGALCYSLQILFDFSGYSDMAIGLGKMFGFEFKENFNSPYRAVGIQDFWRRWHISLSSWFREYVYIPCGGSRRGALRTYRNILIVFLLTGIWHGANWTFFVWGLAYGVLLVLERLIFRKKLSDCRIKPVVRLVTFFIVTILWIVFRADNLPMAHTYICSLFKKGSGLYTILSYLSAKVLFTFVIGLVIAFMPKRKKLDKDNTLARFFVGAFALFVLCISFILLINGTYNPFIYFQF